MTDPDDRQRLADLEKRIAALRGPEKQAEPRGDDHYSQANLGWQMVIELVAGLLIGFGMGYGLDVLFGTLPIFLVLFTLLGFAAGVKTMLRTAEMAQKNDAAAAAENKTAPAAADDSTTRRVDDERED
ncbi:F0F1 ATP synthase subunit I [Aquicoccus sp. SCR17]|nr:F0F1 ATP synthase subunit I [Carideicomes alvinocaridis]